MKALALISSLLLVLWLIYLIRCLRQDNLRFREMREKETASRIAATNVSRRPETAPAGQPGQIPFKAGAAGTSPEGRGGGDHSSG